VLQHSPSDNSETSSSALPVTVAVASPRFGSLAPSPSPRSPSAPAYRNVTTFRTPQEIGSDLDSFPDTGPFYIVTKGREPGVYTDW
jgi:Caulimovirus viroplasmin